MHFDVVVVGWPDDPHEKSVIQCLQAASLSTVCIDQTSLWRYTLTFSPHESKFCVGDIEISSCSLIWYRRPYPTSVFHMSKGEMKFARSEFSHALFGALDALTDIWFTTPEAMHRASHKATQLSWVAKDGRVRIPETLITSNVEEARRFIGKNCSQFIVKTLNHPIIKDDDKLEVMYTSLLDGELYEYLDDIKNAPCIIQRFISRQYEVRVNVIGSQIFGTRLDISHLPEAKIDSRLARDYHDIRHSSVLLPQEISSLSHDLCCHFGLRFGAFDYMVDMYGHWYFLEVNPYGQWAWIQELTNQPLAEAIASEIRFQLKSLSLT
jgi:hypothetical protein